MSPSSRLNVYPPQRSGGPSTPLLARAPTHHAPFAAQLNASHGSTHHHAAAPAYTPARWASGGGVQPLRRSSLGGATPLASRDVNHYVGSQLGKAFKEEAGLKSAALSLESQVKKLEAEKESDREFFEVERAAYVEALRELREETHRLRDDLGVAKTDLKISKEQLEAAKSKALESSGVDLGALREELEGERRLSARLAAALRGRDKLDEAAERELASLRAETSRLSGALEKLRAESERESKLNETALARLRLELEETREDKESANRKLEMTLRAARTERQRVVVQREYMLKRGWVAEGEDALLDAQQQQQ